MIKSCQTPSLGSSKYSRKSKRVRTGCLTCRDRHLKCDESVPSCQNCQKGRRKCLRGIRLNFTNITIHDSSNFIPVAFQNNIVTIRDESRQIASEYQDGLVGYADVDAERGQFIGRSPMVRTQTPISDQGSSSSSILQGHVWHIYISPESSNKTRSIYSDSLILQATEWRKGATVESGPMSLSEVEDRSNISVSIEDDSATLGDATGSTSFEREFLDSPEHVQYMRVYVDEIAVWMDSFNKGKHFGECLPYRALDSPLLLYSLLACGVRRLSHRQPDLGHSATAYYSTANMQLFRYHENPERNIEECSIAATILKLYNIMFREKPETGGHSLTVLNSIISESQWTAEGDSVGPACFWLNAYLDVLWNLETGYHLHFGFWNMELCFPSDGGEVMSQGDEELWAQKMLFILAKVASYRLHVLSFSEMDPRENRTLENYIPEWKYLKQLCVQWSDACPRNLRPLGYTQPIQVENDSVFPKAWAPKQVAIFCRLLYHTAQCMLTQTHPMEQTMVSDEISWLQLHHAREVCGIVAHTDDKYLGPVYIQALLLASVILTDHKEQIEVLEILQRIETQIGYSRPGADEHLKATWGWGTTGPAMPLRYDQGDEQVARIGPSPTQTSDISAVVSPQQRSPSVNTPYTPMLVPRTDGLPQQPGLSFAQYEQLHQYGFGTW
ncbi:hypothetical protein GGI43DRAFT_419726 [Trichoderma evansii]